MLSQKTVQHEAVLATLAALSHPPAPERLYPSLRPSLPQLGLGQAARRRLGRQPAAARRPGRRRGQARAQGRPVTLPVDAARYWLVGVQLEPAAGRARQLLQDGDVPDALANLSLSIGARGRRLPAGAPGRRRNRWAQARR